MYENNILSYNDMILCFLLIIMYKRFRVGILIILINLQLIKVHKPFIYELIPAILELILCLIIIFNLSKSIEIFIITIGIFLIIKSISSFYNTYKGKDEEIIEVEIIEKK